MSSSENTGEKLLIEGVQKLYYIEKQLTDAQETLANQTEHDDAKQAFTEHREETQQHVERLEQVFEQLDEQPEEMTDRVVDAMIEEHEEFSSENSGDTLDRYNMDVAQKVEHYEIASYGNVTSLAGKLGHDEAADLLEETLREEEETLEKLSELTEQFDQQQISA